MEHVPGRVYAGLIDQLRPGATGSGSFSVTDVAVPAVLRLDTVMVKPIGLPELTDAASGVLVTCRLGWLTVVEPVPVGGGGVGPCAGPVLGDVPAGARVRGLV